MIVYADDILLIVEESSIERLVTAANLSVEILARRICNLSLKIAPQKTEAVVFSWTYTGSLDVFRASHTVRDW